MAAGPVWDIKAELISKDYEFSGKWKKDHISFAGNYLPDIRLAHMHAVDGSAPATWVNLNDETKSTYSYSYAAASVKSYNGDRAVHSHYMAP